MCGIAGFFCMNKENFPKNLKNLDGIKDVLKHRGPDDNGIWQNKNDLIAFAHTRLSIQDLTLAGHQPMKSPSGRYLMVYNGEIYNHLEIRKKLNNSFSNIKWHGKSDTETLLNSFDNFGIENTLHMCSGMFSIALWDFLKKELILIKDRFGEKPLYFGLVNKDLIFGSELKVFNKITNLKNEISRESLNLFLRFAYVPSPRSIYKNIFKLSPGSMLRINNQSLININKREINIFNKFKITKWWNAKKVYNNQVLKLYSNHEEAIIDTEKIITESIRSQLISDVPIGTFLSGGIDSSLVSTLMQKKLSINTKNFYNWI